MATEQAERLVEVELSIETRESYSYFPAVQVYSQK